MTDNVSLMITDIRQRKAKKVLLQLPEGLKVNTANIVQQMKEAGIDAIVHNNPSYGACDIPDAAAKQLGCDLIVHIGHNKFYRDYNTAVPVLYFPWILDVSLEGIDFSEISEKRIGLITNIQHLHLLNDVKSRLEAAGKEIIIGGQILGCWTANAVKIENQIDVFLFVGSGVFHSLALKTGKKVYGLDLERRQIELLDLSKMEKRRWAQIYNARDAKSFGILVSTKSGQNQLLGAAEKIKQLLEGRGKTAFILVMDEIRDDRLLGVKVDAFVNTACPRILDDSWSKPIINASDIDRLFDE